ncbi:hypothetical protein Tsubulata_000486 [Turnera subulata]|uniref:Glutaredoxin domain-containing protein n=1 Tax=Turnera subulata TaxID=218843 RepID=A0A9Q0GLR5_9ROSI|nr:hypothetical protein Tsubulata_000486 [Turnera subulata]
MGCVSSNLLSNEDELAQLGSSALSHHIVSLTSTTYGLLNLEQPSPTNSTTISSSSSSSPPTPPPRFTLGSIFPTPLSSTDTKPLWSERLRSGPHPLPDDIINSWELMSGLDYADSFRFSPTLTIKRGHHQTKTPHFSSNNKENTNPNNKKKENNFLPPSSDPSSKCSVLDRFQRLCPPNGENKVVVYTTTLRGIRNTFEACNVVRAAMEGFGVAVCERDVSMDRGFREELRELMMRLRSRADDEEKDAILPPPRVFVRGRYVGGVEEVKRIVEEGWMGDLLQGLPKKATAGGVCEGCGDARFLPCFSCNGSCKMVMEAKEEEHAGRTVVVRCPDCNENGLVLCPICS